MWYVYILLSIKDKKTYVGSTNNVDSRLKRHNNGYVTSTKHRRPLQLLYTEEFLTEEQAKLREKYLKTSAGRRFLKKLFSINPQWGVV